MSKFGIVAAMLCVGSLTACDLFDGPSKNSFGSRSYVPMVSSTGVTAGATSTDIIRNGRSVSPTTKSYRVGASDFPDEMLVSSTATTGNFNSFQNALEIRLPFGKEETSQVAARIADNLGLNARVSGGSIVLGGSAIPSRSLSFGASATTLPLRQLSSCYMKLGACKTDVNVNGRVEPVMVETGQQNGLWYQTVRTADKNFFQRSKLLSHTVFSVDESGTLLDLNTVSYATKEPLMQYVRRVK